MFRILLSLLLLAQPLASPPTSLPEAAVTTLQANVAAAAAYAESVWRDTPPTHADGSVNAFVEIPRGERRKYEFNVHLNRRMVDRVMPRSLGGYPINYGFVPQTVSYDGDPFDALVLGPPQRGGAVVRGVIVGIMHMEDEKGLDSKVVLAPMDAGGRAMLRLTEADQRRVSSFFDRYKRHEPGKFSRVLGWDGSAVGRAFVEQTHRFYTRCAAHKQGPCAG